MSNLEALPKLEGAEIGQVFREEYGRCVAGLIRTLGDIDVAEDAVQDAFAVALREWASGGLPPNPGGWITTTARNMAIDRLRRASRIRPDGSLVLLGEQDRTQWDSTLIEEGQAIVHRCLRRNQPGVYQLQAAINAVHAQALTFDETDGHRSSRCTTNC